MTVNLSVLGWVVGVVLNKQIGVVDRSTGIIGWVF
jgi:hypothetical protein